MTKKEIELINALKSLKSYGYGDYHFIEELHYTIAKVMGYKIISQRHGRYFSYENDEWKKIYKIREGMTKQGLIKWSKSGECWKLVK